MAKHVPVVTRSLAPGVCRMCGCSHFDPCPNGCGWADRGQTVCTECRPAAEAEWTEYRTLRLNPAHATAYHRGFVVGWFAVLHVRHQRQGRRVRADLFDPERNPYLAPFFAQLWDRGRAAGFAARRAYLARHGEHAIENYPREFIYRREVHA